MTIAFTSDEGRADPAPANQFIAHLLFDARLRNIKPRSLPRSELNAMVLLLEAKVTLAQPQGSGPFHFLRGRSPHRVFRLADEPLRTGHHPLVFYAAMAGISQIAYLALYLAGFRYYGGRGTVSRGSLCCISNPSA